MPGAGTPPFRPFFLAALVTAGISLFLFGVFHATFITWAADRSEDPSLLGRLALMFGAPFAIGIPFALMASTAAAVTWQRTRGSRLASWWFGPALATALLPPVVMSLLQGPYGDDSPDAITVLLTVTALIALPALAGSWLARAPAGALTALAALPLVGPWTLFIAAEGLVGWVIPFVISIFAILMGSGWLMARFQRRWEMPAPRPLGEEIASEA